MSPIVLRKQKESDVGQPDESNNNNDSDHNINNNELSRSNSKTIVNNIYTTSKNNNNNSRGRQDTLEIPFPLLAIPTATVQISSLVFCLSWSIKFNFHESTATHCRVENYLPSLSATLDFTPQREIWRACVCLTGFPRFLISYLYYKLVFKSKFLLSIHWLEIVSLIGLSVIDSVRYFPFHALCVGIFLISSIIHMGLVYIDHYNVIEGDSSSSSLSQSLKSKLCSTRQVKERITWINLVSIVTALYLYNRHNQYCEPGIYSLFSFLEYIVIVANIIYHLQACTDLGDYTLRVDRSSMGIWTTKEATIE